MRIRYSIKHKLLNIIKLDKLTFLALLITLAIFLVTFILFKVTTTNAQPKPSPDFKVSFVSQPSLNNSHLMNDLALIFDYEPLFLPHYFSYNKRDSLKEEDLVFEDFKPILSISDIYFSPTNSNNKIQTPLDILKTTEKDLFEGFGQNKQLSFSNISERFAYVTITNVATNAEIQAFDISNETRLEKELLENFWRPTSFLVLIGEACTINFPHMVKSSGDIAIDNTIQRYLNKASFLSDLPPGYYRVTFEP